MHTLNLAFGLLLWDVFCGGLPALPALLLHVLFCVCVFDAFMDMAWLDGVVSWPTQQLCSLPRWPALCCLGYLPQASSTVQEPEGSYNTWHPCLLLAAEHFVALLHKALHH